MSKKYLSLEEASHQLGITSEQLIRYRENGDVRGFADRATWKFRPEDIEALGRSLQADSSPEVPLLSDDDLLPGATPTGLDADCINAIRFLAIDSIQVAGSGHPGTPMGLAPLAWRLWSRFMRYDASAPGWMDRDRFIMSGGHACMLQYASLHLAGYDLTIEDLKQFRQWENALSASIDSLSDAQVAMLQCQEVLGVSRGTNTFSFCFRAIETLFQ